MARRPRAQNRPVWFRSSGAPWDSSSIFHLWARPNRALCGADLSAMHLALPRWLAESFARPCKSCAKREGL